MGTKQIAILLTGTILIGVLSMGLFSWFRGNRNQPPHNQDTAEGVESYPWDSEPSIYTHIKAHIRPGVSGLVEGGETLPDEERLAKESELRWVAGGQDGAFSHHAGGGNAEDSAGELLKLVRLYCTTPTARNKSAVYEYVLKNHAIDFVDSFLEVITKAPNVDHNRLYDLARSFAVESPDREVVKLGIAMLGVFRDKRNKELFLTIGRHEEFTLYCAVALSNTMEDPERNLWGLARNVNGWGRISVVERLAKTQDPEIKDWLIREGYKNSIMYEYLAYTCATNGDLLAAIEKDKVDATLLDSTGDIIEALIAGGPAENIDDYEDGAEVIESYLQHLAPVASSIPQFLVVVSIERFLADDDAEWSARESRGWSRERRAALKAKCKEIMERPVWREIAIKGLESDELMVFHAADRAARALGVDTWPYHWRRLQEAPADSGRWYFVMRECNEDRIAEVISLAKTSLSLADIATGPASEMGFGKEFEIHSCLDYILQDLGKFPGHGTVLIKTGLKSPVVRNRHMALRTLATWGKDQWPDGIDEALKSALEHEPDEDVRESIQKVINGEELE